MRGIVHPLGNDVPSEVYRGCLRRLVLKRSTVNLTPSKNATTRTASRNEFMTHICPIHIMRLEASWRPVANATVLLSGRKFSNAQFREIPFVTLVDLVHRQIFLTHGVETALHL